jgi:NADPH:quinone reductase-like Zn-dependent oxidoreductase
VERIAALTSGRGVDAAFDPMGSVHLRQSVKAVRKGGTLVAYGFYAAANRGSNIVLDVLAQYLQLALWSLPPGRKHVAFYDIRPLAKKHPEWFREDLSVLFSFLVTSKIKPVIAERLPLEEVVRAHQLVENAKVAGKVVLIPNP